MELLSLCIVLSGGMICHANHYAGNRRQDLEPPGAGQQRPAGSQRPEDGCVQTVPRGQLKDAPFLAVYMINLIKTVLCRKMERL